MAKNNCASKANTNARAGDVPVPASCTEAWNSDLYQGTREQLAASIPGLPDFVYPAKGAPAVTYAADGRVLAFGGRSCSGAHRDEDAFITVRRSTKYVFCVYVRLSQAQLKARNEKRADEARAKQDVAASLRSVKSMESNLSAMPTTAKAYSRKLADVVQDLVMTVLGGREQDGSFAESGFAYSEADLEDIMVRVSDLYWTICDARPMFHPDRRGRQLAQARRKAAKLDPAVQGLLATLVASAANEPHDRAAA